MKPFRIKDLPPRATAAAVALVLVASVVTGREKPSDAAPQPAERLAAQIRSAAPGDDLDLEKLSRGKTDSSDKDPFAPKSFAPPAAAAERAPRAGAQASAAPAKPSAPPLPFTYLGKVIEDGKLSVFLARGEQSYSIASAQKLDAEYRIDKVSESAVTFTYLPLNTKQTLDIPAAQ
jgi:hypothetical protein